MREGSCRQAGCALRASATARSTSASVRPEYRQAAGERSLDRDLIVRAIGQGHLRKQLAIHVFVTRR